MATTARSEDGSLPVTVPSMRLPRSPNCTSTRLAEPTTWELVTIVPSPSTTKPVPVAVPPDWAARTETTLPLAPLYTAATRASAPPPPILTAGAAGSDSGAFSPLPTVPVASRIAATDAAAARPPTSAGRSGEPRSGVDSGGGCPAPAAGRSRRPS